MKILIVDDDQLMRKAIGHNLDEEGYEVSMAEDVLKALNILAKEKIDLIVSDVMMPHTSGLGLLSLLKEHKFNDIPVILISSLNKGEIVSTSLASGAAHFLNKPLNFRELRDCVNKVLK